eukprot:TRINITY_DN50311_c0_g1_i1.p1 TRINITY_DN50311_c0_g1~~TRINITY_DN50311_c0_g1_i1.p1  ORF type:complete len:632 (+),score=136.81 TRINITY_DN50311_c0_g1_i1:133-1896(+)
MNNSDFQRLLVTNDKALVRELTNPTKKKKPGRPPPKGGGKGKFTGKGANKGAKGGDEGAQSATGGQLPKGPEYRDRAKERRELVGEYEQIAAEWEGHDEVSLEQSKYLGGDMAHTHLVKGLDFALLSKVRTEISKQKRHEELAGQRMQKKTQKKRTFETVIARKVWHAVVETLHPHHGTFSKRLKNMGKAISMGQRIRGAPSIFLPGRMAYEFDLASDTRSTEGIPRIIYMSKEDAPAGDFSKKVASVLPETVTRVHGCLLRAMEERKQRKREKTLGTEASYAVAQKIVAPKYKARDADDDIFQGAGSFDSAEVQRSALPKETTSDKIASASTTATDLAAASASSSQQALRRASYFDDAGAEKYRQAPAVVELQLDDVTVEEKEGETAATSGETSEVAFKASRKWRGAKPGWVFKLGDHGLGYYLDNKELAAKAAASKAAAREAAAAQKSQRTSKQPSGRQVPVVDDDAYGECFPSAMIGHALVSTGDDGSDAEEDTAKSKIEKLKKLAAGKEGKEGSLDTSSYGKKGKDQDAKKRKMTENQEWQKIESMIKKGKHSSLEELEARTTKSSKHRAPTPREIMSTPAYF